MPMTTKVTTRAKRGVTRTVKRAVPTTPKREPEAITFSPIHYNFFEAMGLPHAAERLAKADMALAIRRVVKAHGWTQKRTARAGDCGIGCVRPAAWEAGAFQLGASRAVSQRPRHGRHHSDWATPSLERAGQRHRRTGREFRACCVVARERTRQPSDRPRLAQTGAILHLTCRVKWETRSNFNTNQRNRGTEPWPKRCRCQ